MVSGVDLPTNPDPLQIEATSRIAAIQGKPGTLLNPTQLLVGKQYSAEVIAQLEDGTYIVNVGNTTARMQLPDSPMVGTKLQLTLIATSPRATFLIGDGTAEITTTTKLNEVSTNPQLTVLESETPESAPAVLSSTGKLIGQLLHDMPEQNLVKANPTPLLPAPNTNPETVANALQNSVSTSGLFYESHIVQWSQGKLPIDELMKEPQASFTPPDSTTLPKEATPLIQQQLQSLEQQRFIWHGELWQGQPLEWEVSRDQSQHQESQSENTWQSAVRFELPQLGAVSAQLHLTGNRLTLSIDTQDAETTQRLQQHSSELISALEGTGTTLDSLLIKTKS